MARGSAEPSRPAHVARDDAHLPQRGAHALRRGHAVAGEQLEHRHVAGLLEQTELTAPYVSRYFSEIPATVRFRHGVMAEQIALFAYPRLAVDPSTVAAADACLAGELDPAVRRAVADRTDDMRRLLRSRRTGALG